jgi:hypothetical protein
MGTSVQNAPEPPRPSVVMSPVFSPLPKNPVTIGTTRFESAPGFIANADATRS